MVPMIGCRSRAVVGVRWQSRVVVAPLCEAVAKWHAGPAVENNGQHKQILNTWKLLEPSCCEWMMLHDDMLLLVPTVYETGAVVLS